MGEWCLHGRRHQLKHCTHIDLQAGESFSLRTVPVWLKANDRQVKINAVLDDGSNGTFINEKVAGVFGLEERYHSVTFNVSNNEVDTFQSMPVEVTNKNFAGVSRKDIKVSARVKKGKFSKFSISRRSDKAFQELSFKKKSST